MKLILHRPHTGSSRVQLLKPAHLHCFAIDFYGIGASLACPFLVVFMVLTVQKYDVNSLQLTTSICHQNRSSKFRSKGISLYHKGLESELEPVQKKATGPTGDRPVKKIFYAGELPTKNRPIRNFFSRLAQKWHSRQLF